MNKLLARDVFDLYADPDLRVLGYARDGCTALIRMFEFFLYVCPIDVRDLPEAHRQHGFDNLDFYFPMRGGVVDEKGWAEVEPPDHPAFHIQTGQFNE